MSCGSVAKEWNALMSSEGDALPTQDDQVRNEESG
jgi:hypothetical protein